jgi:hypothetical protein
MALRKAARILGENRWVLALAASLNDNLIMKLDAASEARLAALATAPLNRWIAMSAEETRIVADADTFEEVSKAAERNGEDDPVIIRIPENWTARTL